MVKYADDIMICGFIDKDSVREDNYHLAVEACVKKYKQLDLIINRKKRNDNIEREDYSICGHPMYRKYTD